MQIFEEIKVIFTHILYFCAKRNAMQTIEIQEALVQLAKSSGYIVTDILPIAESGSSRKYYRIVTETGSLIGTYSTNIEENEAFISFSWHFAEKHLNVPEVLAVSDDRCCYIQNDFGDDNLFNHVQNALRGKGYDEELIRLFKMTLKQLVEFQCTGHQGLDYTKAYPSSCFDRQAIIDDLNYFKYYFVKPHQEIVFNETRLNHDFEAFADFVSQAPNDFFMYRDFQSRNIMLKDGKPYFIDFQGGRKGPLPYDVVSLLYQVKAQMPQDIRDQLIDYYKTELARHISPEEVGFDIFLPYFVYLRLMQVLGAYGFRGLIQKKAHFMESIPFALNEIETHALKHPLEGYPELQSVLNQLSMLNAKYHVDGKQDIGKLTVTINSFSFKKGYPDDFSGNGGGFVFDCRALPNPGREPEFKTKTGRDWEVADYLNAKPQTHIFLDHVKGIVAQSVENYCERHFSNLMISFGCTGGQHRSVFFAQSIYDWLKDEYPDIHLKLNHIEQKIEEECGL